MPNGEIKPGDVVQLKSGGPLMTVGEIKGDRAECHWFDGSKREAASFPAHILEIFNPGSGF